MGWIDRINRYFLDAIARRQPHPSPSSQTLLRMSPICVSQIARLDLASHDGFVGETLMLWATLVDGTRAAISETDLGWDAMRAALDQSGLLPEALHLAELRLLSDPDRKSLCLLGDAQLALQQSYAPEIMSSASREAK